MAQTLFTIGFSPCPNDTFIFDAIVHEKIDTEGLKFIPALDDIETLNKKALVGQLDITKLSFPAFAECLNIYQLLSSGAALGYGTGPLLISKKDIQDPVSEILTVAIPGNNTTANFLFSIFYPRIRSKVEMVFSEIEDAVLSGAVDAGVIIHENRFTYEAKGLKKVADLGELWQNSTGHPVPLGGIAIKRNLPDDVKQKVNGIIRRSVEFAMANPDSSFQYVKDHARELEEEIRKKHIALFVNDFTIDLGKNGKEAIELFLTKAQSVGIETTKSNSLYAVI